MFNWLNKLLSTDKSKCKCGRRIICVDTFASGCPRCDFKYHKLPISDLEYYHLAKRQKGFKTTKV